MNKYQKSLNTIKSLLHDVCHCTAKNLPEMENNLQELVNKSTPKKAKMFASNLFYSCKEQFAGEKCFECVCCGAYQETIITNELTPKYCSYCGQRLDLGENQQWTNN